MRRPREALISARLERVLTPHEAAAGAGIKATTLVNAEDGRRVRMETARKLAAFYERPVVELFPDWAESRGRFTNGSHP